MNTSHAGKMIAPLLIFALIAVSWVSRDMPAADGAAAWYTNDEFSASAPAGQPGAFIDVIPDDGPPLALPPRGEMSGQAAGSGPEAGLPTPAQNNGGGVLQVGGAIYYYALDPIAADPTRLYSVYAMNALGETRRLAGAYAPGRFFASGAYVYTTIYDGGLPFTYRTHMASGGWERLFQGLLEAADEQTGALFFTRDGAEAGLYRYVSGSGERTLWRGDCRFLSKDGGTLYFWTSQEPNSVICSIQSDGTDYRILTVNARDRQASLPAQYIWHFEVCGDWLLYSVGELRGQSPRGELAFEGDFVRLGKDGGYRERIRLSGSQMFFADEDHIYFNLSWGNPPGLRNGVYMTDLDFSGGVLPGQDGDTLLRLTDGQLYFSRVAEDGRIDLCRGDMLGRQVVTLFSGDAVTQALGWMGGVSYRAVEAVGPWVYFTVTVNSPASGNGDERLTRNYRVKADGSDPQLLGELIVR